MEAKRELKELFKLLSTKYGLDICLCLLKGDKTYNQISESLNIPKRKLKDQLKPLEISGLIQNYLQKKEKTTEYSFFEITKYGRNLIEGIISLYNNYYQGLIDNHEENTDPRLFELLF